MGTSLGGVRSPSLSLGASWIRGRRRRGIRRASFSPAGKGRTSEGGRKRGREQKFPLDGAITRSKEEGRKERRGGRTRDPEEGPRDRGGEAEAYIQVHSGRTTREGGRCTHRKSSFPKLSNSSRWALGRRRKRELTTHLWLTASPFLLEAIRITTVADQKGGHLSKYFKKRICFKELLK